MPLVAVVEELYQLALAGKFEFDARYLGPAGPFNETLSALGVKIHSLAGGKYRRYASWQNLIDIPKFIFSFFQAFVKMFILMPDVVFSKGGTGALPVVAAASFYKIPVIIHESDSVPGLTNKFSARFAQRISISFQHAAQFFPPQYKNKLALIGNPIRSSLLKDLPSQSLAKKRLQFNSEEKLILIWGGSLGSTRINAFIFDNLDKIVKEVQVFHQVGSENFDQAKKEAEISLSKVDSFQRRRYKSIDFLEEEDFKNALMAADLIISRAGAGSIFEIAAFGKPSILIPLDGSANDHQKINAYEFSKIGAAIVMEEANLLSSLFMSQLKNILSSPERLGKMSLAAKNFAKPSAGRLIAEEIVKLAGGF